MVAMSRKLHCLFLFLALGALVVHAGRLPTRVKNSPFPAASVPEHVYLFRLFQVRTAAEVVLASSLAGAVAQSNTGNFIYLHSGDFVSDRWYQAIKATGGIAIHEELGSDLSGLLRLFKDKVNGYVMGDDAADTDGTRNAISMAGVNRAVVASPSCLYLVTGAGYRQLGDGRSSTVLAMQGVLNDKVSQRILVHQRDMQFLTDYAVFAKAFTLFDPSLQAAAFTKAVGRLSPYSAALGWTTDEYGFVTRVSADQGKYVLPADYNRNLALFSSMDNSQAQLSKVPSPILARKHKVAFVMSDGDNVQWILRDFADTKWWGSPDRGKVPIGWTFPPSLLELAPVAVKWFQQNKTANDDFVTGPSGLGYNMPDLVPQGNSAVLKEYAALSNRYCGKLGIRTITVIGRDFSKASASSLLSCSPAVGLIWYAFHDYAGLQGAVYWADNGKIIASPRYLLGANMGPRTLTVNQLVNYLNSASTDPTSAAGYTIVAVHVWSATVADVVKVAKAVDTSRVQVVTPTQILVDMKAQIKH